MKVLVYESGWRVTVFCAKAVLILCCNFLQFWRMIACRALWGWRGNINYYSKGRGTSVKVSTLVLSCINHCLDLSRSKESIKSFWKRISGHLKYIVRGRVARVYSSWKSRLLFSIVNEYQKLEFLKIKGRRLSQFCTSLFRFAAFSLMVKFFLCQPTYSHSNRAIAQLQSCLSSVASCTGINLNSFPGRRGVRS